MTSLTPQEIVTMLDQHKKWLRNPKEGKQAVFKQMDLSGANFEGAKLQKSVFSGCKLSRAILRGTNFISADLFAVDLTKADLTNALLIRADLRGAELRGAKLNGANLQEADFRGGSMILAGGKTVTFGSSNLSDSDMEDVIAEKANLTGANLSG
ncbi:MAG: pentapeptide repeat-containing protein, partial [Sneathiella sp.]